MLSEPSGSRERSASPMPGTSSSSISTSSSGTAGNPKMTTSNAATQTLKNATGLHITQDSRRKPPGDAWRLLCRPVVLISCNTRIAHVFSPSPHFRPRPGVSHARPPHQKAPAAAAASTKHTLSTHHTIRATPTKVAQLLSSTRFARLQFSQILTQAARPQDGATPFLLTFISTRSTHDSNCGGLSSPDLRMCES